MAKVLMPRSTVCQVQSSDASSWPATDPKEFLGGYVHVVMNTEYHHATNQTSPNDPELPTQKFERDAQTYELKTCSTQPKRRAGTQVELRGLCVFGASDKILYSKKYQTADELNVIRSRAAITIQSYARGLIARKLACELRIIHAEREAMTEQERNYKALEERLSLATISRREHPRTKKEFETLRAEINAWHASEEKWIKNAVPDRTERRVALAKLHMKELELLKVFEGMKTTALVNAKENRAVGQLVNASQPRTCILPHKRGEKIQTLQVWRPSCIESGERYALYHSLCNYSQGVDERLEVLQRVLVTAGAFIPTMNYETLVKKEIQSLVDREADMLSRDRPPASLKALRERLSKLFLEIITDTN